MEIRIRIIETFIALTVAVAAMFSLHGCSRDKGPKVTIKGSTTVLPITMKAAEEYRKIKKVSISIEGSGSGNGISSLIDGTTDIANSSRQMKPEEVKKAADKGIKVKEIAVAYDMIVPVVHPSNGVENLSMEQLMKIYEGKIRNWKEVGGRDETIVVISRDTSSGTYEVWHEKVMMKKDVFREALLQASNGAILSTVGENRKAIGYIGYGYLGKYVKALKVNGIEGTIENGKSGRFPLSRLLYMYINPEKVKKEAREFIDYLLSAEGQNIVKEAGFIPL